MVILLVMAVVRMVIMVMMAVRCVVAGLGFGADPDFALWVDDAFENGSSGKSATFGNERLSSSGSFGCLSIEVWKIVD